MSNKTLHSVRVAAAKGAARAYMDGYTDAVAELNKHVDRSIIVIKDQAPVESAIAAVYGAVDHMNASLENLINPGVK